MRCYLLLRNNRESGPFTFEELTAQSLAPTDLIWIEGQSVAWKYPTELEALAPFVSHDTAEVEKESAPGKEIQTSKGIFVALPPQRQSPHLVVNRTQHADEPILETRFSQPLETLKEKQ